MLNKTAKAEIHIAVSARTDVGAVRESNQDCLAVGNLDTAELMDVPQGHLTCSVDPARACRGPLLIVCDGMGGSAGGEVASRVATEMIWAEMRNSPAAETRAVYARHLRRAVRVANQRVFQLSRSDIKLRGMGTTVSAAGLCDNALVVAQVGDSRAYLFRGTTLTQVTRDQSIVSALVRTGQISESEARESGLSHVILQALGVAADVEVSLSIVELRRGDRLLLCSDGLYGPVPHEALAQALRRGQSLELVLDQLVQKATAAGAPDNVTAVVAEFSGRGLDPPLDPNDLPRFAEFDPMEEGDQAILNTSLVARRLAARVGIGDDPGPTVVPATGQHAAIRDLPPAANVAPPGPAERALAQRQRLGLVAWIIISSAIALMIGLLLWAGI